MHDDLFFPPLQHQPTTPHEQVFALTSLIERIAETLQPDGHIQTGYAHSLWKHSHFDGVILRGGILERLQLHVAADGAATRHLTPLTTFANLRPYVRLPDPGTGALIAMPFHYRVTQDPSGRVALQPLPGISDPVFYALNSDGLADWTTEHRLTVPLTQPRRREWTIHISGQHVLIAALLCLIAALLLR